MTDPLRVTPEVQKITRELRHEIHQNPEIGTDLPATQASVLKSINGLESLEVSTGTRQSSIVAVLRSPRSNPDAPVILLRADMDALPVEEKVEIGHASRIQGLMHACGHDVHTAGLVGAAHLLHANRRELKCDVVFMFQPAEEEYVGAKWMIEDGVLRSAGRPISAAFGVHVFSGTLEPRTWYIRPGTVMAGCDEVRIVIRGIGAMVPSHIKPLTQYLWLVKSDWASTPSLQENSDLLNQL